MLFQPPTKKRRPDDDVTNNIDGLCALCHAFARHFTFMLSLLNFVSSMFCVLNVSAACLR